MIVYNVVIADKELRRGYEDSHRASESADEVGSSNSNIHLVPHQPRIPKSLFWQASKKFQSFLVQKMKVA